jgi:hypothetical protein
MERQCALETHPETAPQELLHRDVGRSCLPGVPLFAGMGAFDYLSRVCDASFEKRPPRPLCHYFQIAKLLGKKVSLNDFFSLPHNM